MRSKKPGTSKGLIVAVGVVLVVLVAGGGLYLKLQSDKRAEAAEAKAAHDAKIAYVAKLQRAQTAGKVFDERLYDTATRYGDDWQAEQTALSDLAVVRGEMAGSEDATLLDEMLSDGQTISKAVCQCSDTLAKTPELLAAYNAGDSLKVKMGELSGRITSLQAEEVEPPL